MKKSGDSHITVGMWIKPDKKLPQLPRKMLTDQEKEAHLKDIREFYAGQKSTNSVVEKLKSMGHQIIYRSKYAPLIFVRLPIDDVTKVETDTNISNIYPTEVMKPCLNVSALAVNADAAWHSDPNYTGCSDYYLGYIPRIAVIDTSNVKGHPDLPDPNQNQILYYGADPVPSEDHSTMIMGVIAADGPYFKGVAYGACQPLLSAAPDLSFPEVAIEWAITNLATIFNFSWITPTGGGIGLNGIYSDFIVRNYHRTIVAAAGNDGPKVQPYFNCNGTDTAIVEDPGVAWNVITVGAFADWNSREWGDDEFWDCSSYLVADPNNYDTDRQKPEVVAPGHQIYSTSINNGYNAEDGTSLAAPHVAGAAALLIDKAPSLEAWPEEIAAILMASAINDVANGRSQEDDPNSFLHTKDGVGGIDIASAMQVIDDGLNSHHIFTDPNDFPYNEYFSVTQGEKVRAVIRWDSQTYIDDPNNYPNSNSIDVLEADLNLAIYDPNGNYVTVSDSSDNNYEIVGFTANTTGTYRAAISKYRFDGSEEHVGLAICKY
jgi:subtilisin family serine protease